MSAHNNAVLVKTEDNALILTINVPERRNAISREVVRGLSQGLQEGEGDPNIRAVIITGAEGVFCSGGDLSAMNISGFTVGRQRMIESVKLVSQLTKMSKPVIAAVEGWAAGAGFSLALACDSIVGSHSARFLSPFLKVGLIPDFGMLRTLPERVGKARAKQIMLYGEAVDADTAISIGLIDRIAPKGDALTEALKLVNLLSQQAPLPIAIIKAMLIDDLEQVLNYEGMMQAQLFLSKDHAEGKAAFFEKRAPNFKGV